MKVITLNEESFAKACKSLASKIVDTAPPVALIGIATGGVVVARQLYDVMVKEHQGIQLFEVSASRSSTIVKKKSNIKCVFKVLPLSVLNVLRRIESLILKYSLKYGLAFERHVEINSSLKKFLKETKSGCVFVVDDAIDSGQTMNRVLAALKDINPAIDYKTAVLVVTQEDVSLCPDVYLFDKCLIRFPWSFDFKND